VLHGVKSRSRKVNVCKRPGRSVFGRLLTALRGNRQAKVRCSIDMRYPIRDATCDTAAYNFAP